MNKEALRNIQWTQTMLTTLSPLQNTCTKEFQLIHTLCVTNSHANNLLAYALVGHIITGQNSILFHNWRDLSPSKTQTWTHLPSVSYSGTIKWRCLCTQWAHHSWATARQPHIGTNTPFQSMTNLFLTYEKQLATQSWGACTPCVNISNIQIWTVNSPHL